MSRKLRRCSLGILPVIMAALAILWVVRLSAQGFTAVVLDNFESGMRVICRFDCSGLQPFQVNLWSQYPNDFTEGPDLGTASLVTSPVHDGSYALRVSVTPRPSDGRGNLYALLSTNDGANWHFIHDQILRLGGWNNNTFNRLRFWIKVPPQVGAGFGVTGQHNLEIGTFVHASPGANGAFQSAEAGGNHYYHHYNIPYTGAWHQVIVDMHPNHQRGTNPTIEWGDLQPAQIPDSRGAAIGCPPPGLALGGLAQAGDVTHPTCEAGWNYFDALTEMYLDFQHNLPNGDPPADFFLDGFEFYNDTNQENVDQIYSLNAAFAKETNTVTVGWQRRKDHDPAKFEVRYAFSDIFALGFKNAQLAPNGTVTNCYTCAAGYNTMEYSTNAISVGGYSKLYIAVKPISAVINGVSPATVFDPSITGFRQIIVPIPPEAPTRVRIVGQ